MDMDVLERIRRGYRALGPGAPRDVLAMFHQEQDDPPEWVVDDIIGSGHLHDSRDVVAMDLVAGLPPHYEVMGVELSMWDYYRRCSRLVVGGRIRTRPRGTWEIVPLPFIHIWSFSGEQVDTVLDYLSGIEVRRRETKKARRRWCWWRTSGAIG